jgi:hypothetical protein
MSPQELTILYAGQPESEGARRLQHAMPAAHIYWTHDMMEVLAHYVHYAPHLLVFDAGLDWASAALGHIREVTQASPRKMEALLVFNPPHPCAAPPETVMQTVYLADEGPGLKGVIADLLAERAARVAATAQQQNTLPV